MARRKRGSIDYAFIAIPKALITSSVWQELPHAVRALTFDLAGLYTGSNNGRLSVSWVAMSRCGWVSKDTLLRAKKGLLETEFAVLTRKGHPPRTDEWIGLTWWKLDYHSSMDVDPKVWPYCRFLDNLGTFCSPKTVPMNPLRGTKTVPMNPQNGPPSVRNSYLSS